LFVSKYKLTIPQNTQAADFSIKQERDRGIEMFEKQKFKNGNSFTFSS
jgi:hypothetical protein